ncbi:MAG TPA: hypothetical protein VGZ91_07200 [Candidatus Sulfotelmatobacter sp.]|jgi:hypothetical protein|nr:hypothetical protein [Candidatus Sulfotelmatobacter sp.]
MARAKIRVRKAQKLSRGVQRDLAIYALAAGAAGVGILALTPPANAEVIYTKVNQTIDRHQGYAIDLNHDGIVDFRIQNLFRVITAGGYPYIKTFALQVRPGSRVQVGRNGHLEAALLSGENIGPIQPAQEGAVMEWQVGESGLGSYYSGSWLNVTNHYLGLAFRIGGETNFGWARLSIHWNHGWAISADITGYAYETVPNKPIIAGDTGSGDVDGMNSDPTSEMFSEPKLRPTPATLGALALGSGGVEIWRRLEQKTERAAN